MVPLGALKPWAANPRFNDGAVPKLMKLIEEHGFAGVITATPDGVIRAGHTRYKAVQKLGWSEIPVEWKNFPTQQAAEEYALADNKSAEWADWDHEQLGKLFKQRHAVDLQALIDRTGFTKGQIKFVSVEGGWEPGALRAQYGYPPFTVLDARAGEWLERKRAWISMGIQSEIGRAHESGAYRGISTLAEKRGAGASEKSIFDPVLCELLYSWFCPLGGQAVDPFAGGSVRGIVAGVLGRKYWGCDLGGEQIKANQAQVSEIWGANQDKQWLPPVWAHGDATVTVPKAPDADFVFSCPPYGDLEVYGNGPQDLSGLGQEAFAVAYRKIIRLCAARLRPNRFAAFTVGNYRTGRMGYYRDLVGLTVDAFAEAGMGYYNEAILLTPLGTLPARTPRPFAAARKLGKAHQNVLIFVKGDPKLATAAIAKAAAAVPKRTPKRKAR